MSSLLSTVLSASMFILNAAAFICFVMVLIRLFKAKGVLHGILGIFCGLYTFIWGWIVHKTEQISTIMKIWTGCVVVSVVVPFVLVFTIGMSVFSSLPGISGNFPGIKGKMNTKKGVVFNPRARRAKKAAASEQPVKTIPKAMVTGVEILRGGIYDAKIQEIITTDLPPKNPGEKSKKPEKIERIQLEKCKLKEETDKIPAEIGRFFGFEYVLTGRPTGERVELKLQDEIRPIIQKTEENKTSGGESDPAQLVEGTFTSEITEITNIGEPKLIAYRFKNNGDLFTGTWTFRLFYNDRKLAEKTFQIEENRTAK